MLLFILSILFFNSILACTLQDQTIFKFQNLVQSFPQITNPYLNPSDQYLKQVNNSLNNKNQVCALKYIQPSRFNYRLMTFPNINQMEEGYVVTHQGRCAACSTTQDLWVYLTTDLTRTVRMCGITNFYSQRALWKCIKNLGFTDACTQVWMWNTLNTKKHCNIPCIWALITNQPFVNEKNELNKCLQCDQDISGPIFKYQSGRTRRNSGIHSEIDRPEDQIYNITHCYY